MEMGEIPPHPNLRPQSGCFIRVGDRYPNIRKYDFRDVSRIRREEGAQNYKNIFVAHKVNAK